VSTWDRSRVAFVPCFVGRPLLCAHFRAGREKEMPASVAGRLVGRGSRAQWPGSLRFVFSNQSYAHVFRHARFFARARQASTTLCSYNILPHVPLQTSGRTSAPYVDSVCNFLRTLQDIIIIIIIVCLHAKPTERCAYTQFQLL